MAKATQSGKRRFDGAVRSADQFIKEGKLRPAIMAIRRAVNLLERRLRK